LQVRRLRAGNELVGDIIYDSQHGLTGDELYDLEDPSRPSLRLAATDSSDLLHTFLACGQPTGASLDLESARARAAAELAALSPRTRRFKNPQPYPVGLDRHVHERKQRMVADARAKVRHA